MEVWTVAVLLESPPHAVRAATRAHTRKPMSRRNWEDTGIFSLLWEKTMVHDRYRKGWVATVRRYKDEGARADESQHPLTNSSNCMSLNERCPRFDELPFRTTTFPASSW